MSKLFASVTATAVVVLATVVLPLAQSEAPKKAAGVLALDGYCPVAYVEMNQAVKGNPQHKTEHQGRTYHFANAEAKKMFDQAPGKYTPAYDSLCATGVAMGMKLTSDPKLFAIHNGRTYLFSDAKAKGMFEQDRSGIIAKADANWPKVQQQK